ncbi:MAG: HD-GYP domain-containing protein [Lachnoclostridium sp.]
MLQNTLESSVLDQEVVLTDDLEEAIDHGILVSKLAYLLASEMKMENSFCKLMAQAGLVHDIGKLRLGQFLYKKNDHALTVEEMMYIRLHPSIGYEILRKYDYSDTLLQAVHHHHENYDGTGYPDNLSGDNIPLGSRILRICDVFAALVSHRKYRKAYDMETAVKLMIEEVKNFDMKMFLAFLSVIHSKEFSQVDEYVKCINKKNYSWRKILHDGYY